MFVSSKALSWVTAHCSKTPLYENLQSSFPMEWQVQKPKLVEIGVTHELKITFAVETKKG